jgi:GNAT superfamily N-acetyltransferase
VRPPVASLNKGPVPRQLGRAWSRVLPFGEAAPATLTPSEVRALSASEGGGVVVELIFVETGEPPKGAYEAALAALRRFTTNSVGTPDNREFAILVQQSDTGETLGGLWAQSRWGGFYVDMLVVPEESRGQGIGTRLMRSAEAEARRRGCDHMWLDTYAFQARLFYERLGFEVFGQLEGPAPIYPRFFMRKLLG